jgi:hypothetical protein
MAERKRVDGSDVSFRRGIEEAIFIERKTTQFHESLCVFRSRSTSIRRRGYAAGHDQTTNERVQQFQHKLISVTFYKGRPLRD